MSEFLKYKLRVIHNGISKELNEPDFICNMLFFIPISIIVFLSHFLNISTLKLFNLNECYNVILLPNTSAHISTIIISLLKPKKLHIH
jgi:hypothetical protein